MSDDFDNYYDGDFEYDEDFVGDDVHPVHSAYERWRPALAAFAVLITVVAIGMLANDRDNGGASGSTETTVEQSTVPVVTVPLTRTIKPGMKGDDVLRLQQRLSAMHFDPGPEDGVYGQNTVQAVWAFQKLIMQTPRERATDEVMLPMWCLDDRPIHLVTWRFTCQNKCWWYLRQAYRS